MAGDTLLAHYLSPIAALLGDETIADIFVDRFDYVYVSRGGRFVAHPECHWGSEDELRASITQIALKANGHVLDEAKPLLDARLPDGSRVSACVPPVSPHAALTIRVARSKQFSLEELVELGMLPTDLAAALVDALDAYANIFISGATDSGKTTLQRALLMRKLDVDRFFVVEDTKELKLDFKYAICHEVTRNNKAGLTMQDSIRAALRNAPTRIVVGEIRDTDALGSFLETLEAGFRGGIVTMHAGSAEDTLHRAEMIVMRRGGMVVPEAVRSMVRRSIDYLAWCEKSKLDGKRRLREFAAVEKGEVRMLWRCDDHGNYELRAGAAA
jgi:pilus assembly protein CpaF